MKKLSAYLFLILFSFSASSFADDISDFQIEGMSVGDSLLDYFNEKEINNNFLIGSYYKKNEKFFVYDSKNGASDNFEIYDGVQLILKRNDKKLKINSLLGFTDYNNKIENCYKKQNEIVKEFSNSFKELKKKDWGILSASSFSSDINGNYKPVTFDFDNGDRIMVAFYDWSPETNWFDSLKVSIYTKEYRDFINSRK